MKTTLSTITALIVASCTGVSAAPPSPPASAKGCKALSSTLGNMVFAPGSNVYKYENTQFWSNTELANPGCVFRPTCAQDIGKAVKILSDNKAPFALRGGGHMGVPLSNNINDPGVLIVLSNLTNIALNNDKSLLTLAPGFGRWQEVYDWLAPYNLVVAGGRLGPVGVPGLLLAGGINFHGNQVGFSADTVVSYEVVIGDGSIVTATAQKNADLFWALKGGSSNFGIVTEFKMKTIRSKKVWAGTIGYTDVPALYKAIAEYSAAPTDPKAHLVPAVIAPVKQGGGDLAVAILMYDSETESRPKCFEPFFKITNVSDSTAFKTVAQFAKENGAAVVDHIGDLFAAGTFAGRNTNQILQGIQITNDTFYAALGELYANIPSEDIVALQLDWQPLSKTWIQAGLKNNPAGSPISAALSDSSKTYMAYAEVVEWTNKLGNHDSFVASWAERTTAAINKKLQQAGLYDPWTYIGDSAAFNKVYDGYDRSVRDKLISISRKYDQQRVFQKLMPGGFKIE